jgi:hypothetical protein
VSLKTYIALALLIFTSLVWAQSGGSYVYQNDEWIWVDDTENIDNELNLNEIEIWSLSDSLKGQFRDRRLRTNWKSNYKGNQFDYSKKKKEFKSSSNSLDWDLSGLGRLFVVLAKIVGYALIVLVVFLVFRAIFSDSGIVITGFKKRKANYQVIEEEQLDIEDDWLKKALDAKYRGDLRLAVRYYFLAYLKELTIEKHIEFHKDKSNREYRYEIQEQKTRDEFDVLSRVFDYCWYGDFEISQEQFYKVDQLFLTHLKS